MGVFFLMTLRASGPLNSSGTPKILWETSPLPLNADEALRTIATQPLGPAPIERQAAESWLKSLLADGPLTAHQIRQEAQSAGLIYRTVSRAADHLQIRRERGPNPNEWIWKLPDG